MRIVVYTADIATFDLSLTTPIGATQLCPICGSGVRAIKMSLNVKKEISKKTKQHDRPPAFELAFKRPASDSWEYFNMSRCFKNGGALYTVKTTKKGKEHCSVLAVRQVSHREIPA